MCKTTQIVVPTPTGRSMATGSIEDDNNDRQQLLVCPKGCHPSSVSLVTSSTTDNSSTTKRRIVQFHDTVSVYYTYRHQDLSEHEKSLIWLSDDDWEEMRQDFLYAKKRKCPTVEMSQPYRVSDRKASIKYSQIVVTREEEKFRSLLLQHMKKTTNNGSSSVQEHLLNGTAIPCWNCFEQRVACLYRTATKKSRLDALEHARRCEAEVRAMEKKERKQQNDDDFMDRTNNVTCSPKPKFLTAITSCY